MIVTKENINSFEKTYRTKFINSLAGIKQVVLIGTKSKSGKSNLAIFDSLIHLGANPALFGFICRPNFVKRDTLENIIETNEFTINYINKEDYQKAHQTSAKYDKEISEFDTCGFTEEYNNECFAPFVKESPIKIALKLVEKIEIKTNKTILVVGSIESVTLDAKIISNDGFVGLNLIDTVTTSGLDAYYENQLITRLSYAKPNKKLEIL